MTELDNLKKLVESFRSNVDSTVSEAKLSSNKLRGTPVIDNMYKKLLDIQGTVGKEPDPIKRIQLMKELTDLLKTI